jgi:hypothetical protein
MSTVRQSEGGFRDLGSPKGPHSPCPSFGGSNALLAERSPTGYYRMGMPSYTQVTSPGPVPVFTTTAEGMSGD